MSLRWYPALRRTAAASVCAAAAGFIGCTIPAAHAQTTFATVTSLTSSFSYNQGSGLSVTPGSPFLAAFMNPSGGGSLDFPATLSFTGLNNVGDVLNQGSGVFSQALSGGTFTLTSGANVLLTGTFSSASLTASTIFPLSLAADLESSFSGVTYTGGSYFTSSGLASPGSFSFLLAGANTIGGGPGVSLNGAGTKFRSFTSGGIGGFSAMAPAPTPEPSEWAFGGMVAASVGGLMLRARRRRTAATRVAA